MIYPGNADLSPEAQERVLSTFRKVVANLQAGRRDDAVVGLDFVLRLDPEFRPAVALHHQLEDGVSDIDLGTIVSDLQSRSEDDINASLVEAVDLFNDRRFLEAKEIVERALLELPGHKEARQLLKQIQDALKLESRVADYLTQAEEALESGDPEGSANFVLMAQSLDPHHPGIGRALSALEAHGAAPAPAAVEASDETEPEELDFSFGGTPPSGGETGPEELDFGAPKVGEEPGKAPSAGEELSFGADEEISVGEGAFGEASGSEGGLMFEPAPEEADEWPPEEQAAVVDEELDDEVRSLFREGQEAFDAERYEEAINAWSKIYLVDPSSDLAGERIDAARQRLEREAQELETLYDTAADAAENGRTDEALDVLETVLERQPDHLAARDLRDRLRRQEGSPAEVPAAETAPSKDRGKADEAPPSSLFDQQLDDAVNVLPEPDEEDEDDVPRRGAEALEAPTGRRLPIRTIALGIGAVLVVAVAAWVGFGLFADGGDGTGEQEVQEALRQAQGLFEQNRVQEAIHLLEGIEASELDQSRVDLRIARYRKALTPPTPTPVPQEVVRAEDLLEAGRPIAAYRLVRDQLEENPDDTGLLELRDEIRAREPLVSSLDRAITRGDPATALSIARQLEEQHPESIEAQQELERWLFNNARAELKAYNLTGAEVLLEELARLRPDDADVQRVLEFIDIYKRRSVDMQLKIFINSLDAR